MDSSRENENSFLDGLRQWAKISELGSVHHVAIPISRREVEPRVAEEKKISPQGLRGKQQARICKQPHRRSSKGNIKILPANESNFKALVFEHTCKPSPCTPHLVLEPTSPMSLQSNSSGLTWGSMSEATGVSISQPGSPKTPTSLLSNMGFLSQPTSPLSHSRPTSFSPSPLYEALPNAVFTGTHNENSVPRCASAPCLIDAGWSQGVSSSILADWHNTHLRGALQTGEQSFVATSKTPSFCVEGLRKPLPRG